MTQNEYLEFLIYNIKNNIEISEDKIKSVNFYKILPFHKTMLWEKSLESNSIYYEDFFSKLQSPNEENLKNGCNTLLKNNKTTYLFFDHFFKKYKDIYISENQQNIVNFPLSFFNLLYPRTLLTASKVTHGLNVLFSNPIENKEKIQFFIDNQNKKFIPFHNDMYYFILFTSYMKLNSDNSRKYFCQESQTFKFKPVKITDEMMFTAKIIYDNFTNIFDFIKSKMITREYQGTSFKNIIINENEFVHFINFISASLNKDKIEEKFKVKEIKFKPTKI